MARKPAEHDANAGAMDTKPPKRLATWQIASLIVAGVVTLAGAAMWVYSAATSEPDTELVATERHSNLEDMGVNGFAPVEPGGDHPGDEVAQEGATDQISPAIFRLGFSFVVGFALAYALRTFLKLTLLVVGVIGLAIFGLSYFNLLHVDWTAMSDRFDSVRSYLATQTESFKTFITGQLPSAASALAGMAVGFKKK